MKKSKKGKHTGKIRHGDMTSLMHGVGGKDPHASAEHHAMNSAHGMPEGMAPSGETSEGGGEQGGEGMAGNCEYC